MGVAEIGGELRQLALHVASFSIPAHERRRRQVVPQVMKACPAAVAAALRRRPQAHCARDEGKGVAGAPLGDPGAALGEEEGPAWRARRLAVPLAFVASQGVLRGSVKGDESSLAELAMAPGEQAAGDVKV